MIHNHRHELDDIGNKERDAMGSEMANSNNKDAEMSKHIPVLRDEASQMLAITRDGIYLDLTAGYGGHSEMIYQQLSSQGQLIMFDRDPEAITYIKNNMSQWEERWRAKSKGTPPKTHVIHTVFSAVKEHTKALGVYGQVSGVLADLGVSNAQLTSGYRGFSFICDGPLDMRMDTRSDLTASDVLRTSSFEELRDIFTLYGEEPKAHYVAQAIVQQRKKKPITTTHELADLVKQTIYYRKPAKRHPATRIFQALRIYVNQELKELSLILKEIYYVLNTRGRCGIIAFHSLEDRLVKQHIKQLAQMNQTSQGADIQFFARLPDQKIPPQVKIITPFPCFASKTEIEQNAQARSARLRVFEKL
ncbi:MAG: 16S rRNA (cytosine(1402)-N(4))-methyltransferase RsmH [Proteobacteria bacterium]|nr:16S rRNA (cytosine(1402)-N(4))-methyltransferase RsmH [Pseudomonadota bacterium]